MAMTGKQYLDRIERVIETVAQTIDLSSFRAVEGRLTTNDLKRLDDLINMMRAILNGEA